MEINKPVDWTTVDNMKYKTVKFKNKKAPSTFTFEKKIVKVDFKNYVVLSVNASQTNLIKS